MTIDLATTGLDVSTKDAAGIVELGGRLVTHTAQGLPFETINVEFIYLQSTHIAGPDSARWAGLTFVEIVAEHMGANVECHCGKSPCEGLKVAFAEGDVDGPLRPKDAHDVEEPMRTIGRTIGACLNGDGLVAGALLQSVPDDQLNTFVRVAFAMAVDTTRQAIAAKQ